MNHFKKSQMDIHYHPGKAIGNGPALRISYLPAKIKMLRTTVSPLTLFRSMKSAFSRKMGKLFIFDMACSRVLDRMLESMNRLYIGSSRPEEGYGQHPLGLGISFHPQQWSSFFYWMVVIFGKDINSYIFGSYF